jgi:nucleotide-binding universal stress UspA family protein
MKKKPTSARVPLQNILYATDFSKYSMAALPYALSIARQYGSTLFVVHVIHLSALPHSSPAIASQTMTDQAMREAKSAIKSLVPQLKGIPHKTLIRKGDIWSEICAVIGEKRIDLAIVGAPE